MKVLVIFLASCIVFGLAIPAHAEEQHQFHKGHVEWESRCFMVGSDVTLRVTDPDMNRNPELIEEINVAMWSDNDNREVMYTLTETGKDTGVFDANVFLTTTDGSPGKRLRIVDGSIVSAKYVDYTYPESYKAVDIVSSFTASGLSVLERHADNRISKIIYDPCALILFSKNPDKNEQIDVFYPSPLQQLDSGLFVNEIQCKQNLVLVQKYDGSPACVTESTKTKLIERGWITTKGEPNTESLPTFDFDITTDNTKHGSQYQILGGKVDTITYDEQSNSLIITLNESKEGYFQIVIPSGLLHISNREVPFVYSVMIDDEYAKFKKFSPILLKIPFEQGAKTIKISGISTIN